jgi:hypothetical protein
MKKIVGLSLALMLVIGITGAATFANFTDDTASSGNLMAAGTLDLKTNDADGVSQTLYALTMAPGDTIASSVLTLKNAGTIDGATMDIIFSYEESDGIPNSVDKTADEVAAVMEVIALDYGGSSLLGSIGDANGNGYIDLEDLKNSNLTGLNGIAAAATKSFNLSVRLKSDTVSDFQADGITMTMTFILNQ